MWAISKTADTDRARTFLQGKAFSLLMNAVADEFDRLMYKSNLMFNSTPTVAPDALIAVLTQQLNHATIEVILFFFLFFVLFYFFSKLFSCNLF